MIEKLKLLQKVKEKREFAALRLMRAKKSDLFEMNKIRNNKEKEFRESRKKLPEREDGAYDVVLNKIVDLDELDILGERLSELHRRHRKTEEDLDLSTRQREKLAEEAAITECKYQIAQRNREKYDALIAGRGAELALLNEKDEEALLEDVVANRSSGHR
ncbi:hypothetical protein SIAM614_01004 [Stappia aggregata IAM 12614]|uniref:Type III secretion system (T3SS) protein YscO n=1 Tax=Roseibium aggregatum (strain ATCC 25650 / DSM 13394 / JCM 20685 / NBRC 16684 / NCIMB 2208 / IAM 12614 / B1) TaxID=384765 RepID=A0P0L1_ROSAI|nr:YscO family type III secretion system apparatus protein [Roseibium aggregatum]EAV41325.1 hypothetical protein SIAM614_01004 [Stappia aggregata IAM 12614] [Roseibium aggregatum IAM 12614]